ncbi:MAG: 50S ribosomal protein L10 [Myxococcota bacterium]
MTLSKDQKTAVVAAVRDRFSRSVSSVFVDFRGIDVATITELRTKFRAAGIEYQVVKNNLVRKALEETPIVNNEVFMNALVGPTGIAWSYEDPSSAAKILRDFRKERKDEPNNIEIKCGILDDAVLDGDRVEKDLASLPGKDEIRSMLLAQLMAPAEQFVRQIGAPAQNLAYALDAYCKKQEGGV